MTQENRLLAFLQRFLGGNGAVVAPSTPVHSSNISTVPGCPEKQVTSAEQSDGMLDFFNRFAYSENGSPEADSADDLQATGIKGVNLWGSGHFG